MMLRAFGGPVRGLVLGFVSLGFGILTWLVVSNILGENQRSKGFSFLLAGLFAMVADVFWRQHDGKAINFGVMTGSDFGACLGRRFPFWVAGIVIAVCGGFLAFSDD